MPSPYLSLFFIIAFSVSLLFACILIVNTKKEWRQPGVYLLLLVVIFGYKLFESAAVLSGAYVYVPRLLYWLPGMVLWLGPAFYFYVKAISGDLPKKRYTILIHFIPAVLIAALLFQQNVLVSNERKIAIIEYSLTITDASQLAPTIQMLFLIMKIHLFSYLRASWLSLKETKRKFSLIRSDGGYVSFLWQQKLCIGLFVLELVWLVLFFVHQLTGINTLETAENAWLLFMAVFVLSFVFWGIQNANLVLSTESLLVPDGKNAVNDKSFMDDDEERNKYGSSALPSSMLSKIAEQIVAVITNKQLYLDANFKLADLANEVGLRSHIVSQAINGELNTTFLALINKQRVEHAKGLLDQSNSTLTVEHIALESGFNNRVTFNTAFKEFEGMSPSTYKKQCKVAKVS